MPPSPPSVRSTILLHARPGAASEGIGWDPWRRRWQVRCRAPPAGGAANEAIRRLLAGWLGVAPETVRWVRAGRDPDKTAEVLGLTPEEVERRLRAAATPGEGP